MTGRFPIIVYTVSAAGLFSAACAVSGSPSKAPSVLPLVLLTLVLAAAALWFVLHRSKKDTHRFMTSTRLSIMDKEVQRACKFLEQEYADNTLTLESIAAGLITGPAFLEKLFLKELGMGVMEFLSQIRVNRIKLGLSGGTAVDSAELVLACGFADAADGADIFVKITGLSIGEFSRVSAGET